MRSDPQPPASLRRSIVAAAGFYLLSIALGVGLRFFFLRPYSVIDFGNAVHAHSHTLFFGWGGLALVALSFARLGARDAAIRRTLAALVLVSAATFPAFLVSGYGLGGRIVSGVAVPVWIAAAVVFLRRARGSREVDVAWLRAGFVYLSIACLAAAARMVLVFAGPEDPVWGKLAVFAFLHDFAFFLVFCAVGLLHRRLGLADAPLRLALRIAVPLAWLTFPLGVSGGAEGLLGLVARAAALGLLLPALLVAWQLWRAGGAARWLACWFFAQSAMEASGALGLSEAAIASRHLAMLYLHVLLLGFVTQAIWLELSQGGRARTQAVHGCGLLVMSAGLLLAGAGGLGLRLPDAAARAGHWLAFSGGVICLLAGLLFALPLFRRGLSPASRLRQDGVPPPGAEGGEGAAEPVFRIGVASGRLCGEEPNVR